VAAKDSEVEDESEGEAEESVGTDDESSQSETDEDSNDEVVMTDEERKQWEKRRKQIPLAFRRFATYSENNVLALNEVEATAVKIMHKLIKKRAPLDTYEAVMRWHLIECGHLAEHESLGECPFFITRQKLIKDLRIRYHMDHQYARPQTIVLPFCRSKIQVWRKYAHDNVLSLLTDPRWSDEDWLYVDDDPFAPPPVNSPFIEDINTGEAYIKTSRNSSLTPLDRFLWLFHFILMVRSLDSSTSCKLRP
jgi:hypothetical protein